MKPQQTELSGKRKEIIKILIIGITILTLQLIFHLTVGAKEKAFNPSSITDTLQAEMKYQLDNQALMKKLNFPKTVKRFYAMSNGETNWLKPAQNIGPTTSAMLLLDCVQQYGLQRENYHPEVLTYALMYDVLNNKNNISVTQKVEFEVMLTDAMISMVNHLHYGRLNPNLSEATIDNGLSLQLRAEELLIKVANSQNLMDSILTVQPAIAQYRSLQHYMKLITGKSACDSYETSKPEIQAIALNMERLRWSEVKGNIYLHVNIPSFQLAYVTADSTHHFKVIVGAPSTPTPTLASTINYIETAPDWKIPHKIFIAELLPKAEKNLSYFENNHIAIYDEKENFVAITPASIIKIKNQPKKYHARQTSGCDNALGKVVFRFDNSYSIYLHDTPEQQYFKRTKRALSHGCIRVEQVASLAAILLTNDRQASRVEQLNTAMSAYKKQQFSLRKPVPILITYLTLTVEAGLLTKHDDIYKLDNVLAEKMYTRPEQITNTTLKN